MLHGLAGRYDNPMPELTLSPSQGSMNDQNYLSCPDSYSHKNSKGSVHAFYTSQLDTTNRGKMSFLSFTKKEYTVCTYCTGGIQNYEFLPFVFSFMLFTIIIIYLIDSAYSVFTFFQTCRYAKNIEINMKCVCSQLLYVFRFFSCTGKKSKPRVYTYTICSCHPGTFCTLLVCHVGGTCR
jgi:hypothetical protein